MKKALFLVLGLVACGNDGDSNEMVAKKPSRYDTPAEKPAAMKIDPALKPAFVKDCEAAAENSPDWFVYIWLASEGNGKTCSERFDIIAKKRSASLGVLSYNNAKPLDYLPFLESLTITHPADGLEAKILKMTNLQKISFERTNISDIKFLTKLRYLNSVSFSESPVTNVSPLEPLTNLRFLFLDNLRDKQGKPTLAKDEAHCPVKSTNDELNFACKMYREEK